MTLLREFTQGGEMHCDVCGQSSPPGGVFPAAFVRPVIAALIRKEHPDWNDQSHICLADLNHFRSDNTEE